MNLENYMKHADGCALLKPFDPVMDRRCLNCKSTYAWHQAPTNNCPLLHATGYETNQFFKEDGKQPTCTCSLDSIQYRLVLLPDGLKEKIVEVMKRYESDFTYKGDWFNAVHSDNFNTVAEDIVKAVNK